MRKELFQIACVHCPNSAACLPQEDLMYGMLPEYEQIDNDVSVRCEFGPPNDRYSHIFTFHYPITKLSSDLQAAVPKFNKSFAVTNEWED